TLERPRPMVIKDDRERAMQLRWKGITLAFVEFGDMRGRMRTHRAVSQQVRAADQAQFRTLEYAAVDMLVPRQHQYNVRATKVLLKYRSRMRRRRRCIRYRRRPAVRIVKQDCDEFNHLSRTK